MQQSGKRYAKTKKWLGEGRVGSTYGESKGSQVLWDSQGTA